MNTTIMTERWRVPELAVTIVQPALLPVTVKVSGRFAKTGTTVLDKVTPLLLWVMLIGPLKLAVRVPVTTPPVWMVVFGNVNWMSSDWLGATPRNAEALPLFKDAMISVHAGAVGVPTVTGLSAMEPKAVPRARTVAAAVLLLVKPTVVKPVVGPP